MELASAAQSPLAALSVHITRFAATVINPATDDEEQRRARLERICGAATSRRLGDVVVGDVRVEDARTHAVIRPGAAEGVKQLA